MQTEYADSLSTELYLNVNPAAIYLLKVNNGKSRTCDMCSKVYNKDTRRFIFRNSRPDVFCKKVFLEISQNSQENTCTRVNLLKNRLWHKRFSCEFCEISQNTFSHKTSPVAASASFLVFPAIISKKKVKGTLMQI